MDVMQTVPASTYTGRFAPSPTGPLHFGSLVAALASYLDARVHSGHWFVRIEDVDRQRSIKNADKAILDCLHAHGLQWDEPVRYQSACDDYYQTLIDTFFSRQLAYYCTCTRKMIRQQGEGAACNCRNAKHGPAGAAVRIKLDTPVLSFNDRIQGQQQAGSDCAIEDMVLRRRDGHYAYNLAVVADDIKQGVTHIVRGSDLLPTTLAHLSLYQMLNARPPTYAHIPVAATEPGYKLSKQNKATAIDPHNAKQNLVQALKFLHLYVPDTLHGASCDKILNWATKHFKCETLPKVSEIIVDKQQSAFYKD